MFQIEYLSLSNNLPARRLLLLFLPVLLLTQYIDAHAQTVKLPRVGVVTTISSDRPQLKGLRDGLEAAGYAIGMTLILDVKQRKDFADLESAARRFVKDCYDVLVTTSDAESVIAQRATREIPIVFMPASNIKKLALIKSYARTDTNLTGITYYRDNTHGGKLLELFKQLAPELKSLTLFTDGRAASTYVEQTSSIRQVAAQLSVQVTERLPRTTEEVFAMVSRLRGGPTQGVLINCTILFANLSGVAALAKEKKIPLQGCTASHVSQNGALFSYGPDLYDIGRRGAWYVDRILKGAKPQDLPVESPRKFEFVINLQTATHIGLKVPPGVLQRADRVIE